MKFSFSAMAKLLAFSTLTIAAMSCNNASQTPEEQQKDAADSIKKKTNNLI